MTIHPRLVQHDTHFSTATCDTAGCPQGFQYQSEIVLDIEHTEELMRTQLKRIGWTQIGEDDFCTACSNEPDIHTDSNGRTLRRVHYGNGVSGWTARVSGPTKTTSGEPS